MKQIRKNISNNIRGGQYLQYTEKKKYQDHKKEKKRPEYTEEKKHLNHPDEKKRLENAVAYIEHSRRFGNLPGVETCRKLLKDLGHPEQSLKIIHVAGTNGKGSVSAFLHQILKEAGYKTGLFSSPHLLHFSERICINGNRIADRDLLYWAEFVINYDFGIPLTMFDYALAIALLYFGQEQCDYVVMETGLGGKQDSTNAVANPVLSVITHIGYDHTEVLGNSLSEIAAEKAGILKSGVPAVFGCQEKEASDTLISAAEEKEIAYVFPDVGALCRVRWKEDGNGYGFFYKGQEYQISMPAKYQVENALTAIEAAYTLQKSGCDITQKEIAEGIRNTFWSGRMQILKENPFLMADGAHNPDGVRALAESLRVQYPGEKFVFWMAVLADKDYKEMVSLVLPVAEEFITVTPDSSRALQSERLAEYIRSCQKKVTAYVNVEEVFAILERYPPEQKIIAFGSLYFIGEILKSVE